LIPPGAGAVVNVQDSLRFFDGGHSASQSDITHLDEFGDKV